MSGTRDLGVSDSREVRVPLVNEDVEQALLGAEPPAAGKWVPRPPPPQPKSWWKEHYLRLPERKQQVPNLFNLWGLLCQPHVLAAEILVTCRLLVCYDIALDVVVSAHIDRKEDPAWFCTSVFLIVLPIAIKIWLFKRLCLQYLERPTLQGGLGWGHRNALVAYFGFGWIAFPLLDFYLLLLYPWVAPTDYEFYGPLEMLSPIIETFFESIEQTALQLWMCYRLHVMNRKTHTNMKSILLYSVLPGLFNILKKLYDLKKAANLLGMGFCTYIYTLVAGPLGITAPFVELLAKREDLSYKDYGELFPDQQKAIFQALGPQNKVMRRIEFADLNRVQLGLFGEHVRGNTALRHVELGWRYSLDEVRGLFQVFEEAEDLEITVVKGMFSWQGRQAWLSEVGELEKRAAALLEKEFLGKDLTVVGQVHDAMGQFLRETGATSWASFTTFSKCLMDLKTARSVMRPRQAEHIIRSGTRLKVERGWAQTKGRRRSDQDDRSYRRAVVHLMRLASAKLSLEHDSARGGEELRRDPQSEDWPQEQHNRQQRNRELHELQTTDTEQTPEPKPRPLHPSGDQQAAWTYLRNVGKNMAKQSCFYGEDASKAKMLFYTFSGGKLLLYKYNRQHEKPSHKYAMDGAEYEIRRSPLPHGYDQGGVHVRLKLDARAQQSVILTLSSRSSRLSGGTNDLRILKNAVKCSRYISEFRPDEGRTHGLETLMRGIDSPAAHLHKAWDGLVRLWRLLQEMDEVNEAPKERFQQSVLLEVWSAGGLIQSRKFLGECWLPNLSEFTPQMKDALLPLKASDFREDAEGGPSRWDKDKEIAASHPGPPVSGELFVSVGWTFPIADPAGFESVSEQTTKARTGNMQLRITKGKSLTQPQVGRSPDAQVLVWIRNDHTMAWREAPSAKTHSVRQTRNPHFNYESSIELIDGPVEK